MQGTPRRWTWWRIMMCVVGALLVLAAGVVLLVVPTTVTGQLGAGEHAGPVQVISTDQTPLKWGIALAAGGIAAIVAALVLPRKRMGTNRA